MRHLSLKFRLTKLSFVCQDKSRCVVQWNVITVFTDVASRPVFEHHLIYSKSVEVAKMLAKVYLYFLEESQGLTSNDSNLYPQLHPLSSRPL